ncbi:hypothetical protein M378DRAFT_156070, partial [Amanita muscaria Koide BX008]
DLVLRPRRCGKSTMLQMLNSFFRVPRDGDPDPRLLFAGLDIARRQDICTEHMGKYPVIFCDFKSLTSDSWEGMLSAFSDLVSELYAKWEDCLLQSLRPSQRRYFESILDMTATKDELMRSLYKLTLFLADKFRRNVIVLIDEYEAPNNRAYEHGYFKDANDFFGRGVLPNLLKSNKNLQYAVLVGVTPTAKSGWYSGLNNLQTHALHSRNSPFAGMLMFTEPEVIRLITLAKTELKLADLKAQYNSYIAAGQISVYNPVSVMSALKTSEIKNFWVATGEYPLLSKQFPDDDFDVIEVLLTGAEIEFVLMEDVTFTSSTLSKDATLTLLYYAGYLTMTGNGRAKIPNPEVMTDWARWITGAIEPRASDVVLKTCVEGPIRDFTAKWPNFMQQNLDPKLVGKARGAVSNKTPEKIYHVFFLGLMLSTRAKGWEVSIEPRTGSGFVDIRLRHRRKRMAVLIELKSSEKRENMERDANRGLDQIVENNYRNPEGLLNICTLREYGIAGFHLDSYVRGRYLELDGQNQWVEKDDPVMSVS